MRKLSLKMINGRKISIELVNIPTIIKLRERVNKALKTKAQIIIY